MSKIKTGTTLTTAYQVEGDTTGTLVIQTGSTPTTAVTIDASQNVGIGTSSPSQKLEVAGTIKSTSSTAAIFQNSTATGSNALRVINNSGSVYFGTENSAGTDYSLPAYAPFIYANYSTPICFVSNGTERMRIDSSGNLLVNTTSSYGGKVNILHSTAGDNALVIRTSSGTYTSASQVFQNSSGGNAGYIQITGASSVSYVTTSDYRLKENIAPMTGALEKVTALKPVTYTWKEDGTATQGFIAHELQEVVPECVVGEKDAVETYTDEDGIEQTRPKYQGIDTSFLVATLTAAIQELKAELDAAKADIATLKGAA